MGSAWWRQRAVDVVEALREKRVTPLELVRSARRRIEEVEGKINAVPTTCFERAERRAREMDHPASPPRGYLYGLPVLIKDTLAVSGVRFTRGSLVHEHDVADHDDPVVSVLEAKGAIIMGKTNTPEYGLGSNTYNDVFGETLNPFDIRLTCGGSSGGAASALAAGEAWIAIGTDLGGSLRIPASFCGVVGLRPTPGVVPNAGSRTAAEDNLHAVVGPMARNVTDLALLMDAISEKHPEDGNSVGAGDGESYVDRLKAYRENLPTTIAWSSDLGGSVPMQGEVARICERAAKELARIVGAAFVDEACMDLSKGRETFHVLRAEMFKDKGALLHHEDVVKPELIWQVNQGLSLKDSDLDRARESHKKLLESTLDFFQSHDLLCSPCTMVPPFDVKTRWLRECEGWELETYIDWLLPTSVLSLTNCPSISLPCGFTEAGLPVGLQLTAPASKEAELMCAAYAYERANGHHEVVPIDPRP